MDKSRHLITCADEKTWISNEPIVFLGNWCLLNERKNYWKTLDYKIIKNHWSDSNQIYKDSKFVNKIYEKLLSELVLILNT